MRLPGEKRKEYHAQVDNLVSELKKRITDKSKLKVTKVVKAGSFAKFTILRKVDDYPTDVDVVFYITGVEEDSKSYEDLCTKIYDLLIEIYPTKKVDDFEIQRRAAKVTFVKSGLEVDVVPVLQDSSNADHGWQYDIQSGAKNLTCAPCHIQFVKTRKDKDKNFRTLVRLAKRWKHFHDIPGLKSFHIELILGHILDTDGPADSIEKRFREFLAYIARTKLKEDTDLTAIDLQTSASSISLHNFAFFLHTKHLEAISYQTSKRKITMQLLEAWALRDPCPCSLL